MVKNCDLGHSFSPYGPPRRQITYIYVQYIFNTCTSSIDFTFVLVVKCGKLCFAWSIPSMIRDKNYFGFTLALMLCL